MNCSILYFVEVIPQELILQSPLLIIIKEEPKWVITQISQLLCCVNNLHKNKQICGFNESVFTQNVNIMLQKKSLLILWIKVDFFSSNLTMKKKSSLHFVGNCEEGRQFSISFDNGRHSTLCLSWERGHDKDFWSQTGVRLLWTPVPILEIYKLSLIDDYEAEGGKWDNHLCLSQTHREHTVKTNPMNLQHNNYLVPCWQWHTSRSMTGQIILVQV